MQHKILNLHKIQLAIPTIWHIKFFFIKHVKVKDWKVPVYKDLNSRFKYYTNPCHI